MNRTRPIAAAALLLATAACTAPATRHAAHPVAHAAGAGTGTDAAFSHGDRSLPYVAPEPEPVTETATPAPAPRKPAPTASPSRTTPHFRTPEGAMRYLARAYNAKDVTRLKHVTNPEARSAMLSMRPYAPDLRLDECRRDRQGDMYCYFSHGIPGKTTRGSASVMVAPAARPGWYMTGLIDCGED